MTFEIRYSLSMAQPINYDEDIDDFYNDDDGCSICEDDGRDIYDDYLTVNEVIDEKLEDGKYAGTTYRDILKNEKYCNWILSHQSKYRGSNLKTMIDIYNNPLSNQPLNIGLIPHMTLGELYLSIRYRLHEGYKFKSNRYIYNLILWMLNNMENPYLKSKYSYIFDYLLQYCLDVEFHSDRTKTHLIYALLYTSSYYTKLIRSNDKMKMCFCHLEKYTQQVQNALKVIKSECEVASLAREDYKTDFIFYKEKRADIDEYVFEPRKTNGSDMTDIIYSYLLDKNDLNFVNEFSKTKLDNRINE